MTTEKAVEELCREVMESESDWRYRGPEGRHAAYERFQRLVRAIAEMTGTTYEEAFNDAIEQWVKENFCEIKGKA
jgi:hypothetical protein